MVYISIQIELMSSTMKIPKKLCLDTRGYLIFLQKIYGVGAICSGFLDAFVGVKACSPILNRF